ncbi:PREDICTED: zinc finger protein 598 isoform X3 [Haliaeetus leucocephalus]|uniref:zinc finger protein 598 isoform X3 n=1 Tax=Haliaeetus leucocephalus TaxID=52644 RepID=UPI00053CEB33|nr:PREDICTED: zinc finger protein 598 isoform X3 [Haliaeetus leucocephalus]
MAASASGSAAGPPDRSCVLCCGELEVVALGRCDHPICYRCSVRMRALCGVRYCAVCREELGQVVFGRKLTSFSTIALNQLQHEKKYDIYFTDGDVYALYRKLLQHECSLCPDVKPFNTFADLEQHMRKQHELFCCKLCVKHLKIFTYERKWYSRKDLARHRIHGDPDDTSHRGHPLCKFCDERYLDNDELLKHLRRDHYFCHFCDSDGAQEYYSDYEYLREHFREKHFLCEEGRCSTEQFTHAFRTEIDYKAHKTACHSKNRAEARQNRQIDLQFNYAPRHQRRSEGVIGGEDYEEVDRYNRQGRSGRLGGRGSQQNRRGSWRYKSSAQLAAVKLKEEDFPSLSSSTAPTISSGMSLTYTATAKKTAFQEEDFPALVSKMRPNNKTVTNITSAWNNGSSKNVVKAISNPCVNQIAKKTSSLNSTKGSKKSNKLSQSDDEDNSSGLTTQEIRSTPTMFDVSSLLAASTSQTFTKVSKKKKMGIEKQRPSSPHLLQETSFPRSLTEKLPEAEQTPNASSALHTPDRSAAVMNGHLEKSLAICSTPKEPPGLKKPTVTNKCPLPQEDFPALGSSGSARMPPPPGFNTVVLLKSPPPPPGLSVPVSKPPPGFAVIPSTKISEPVTTSLKEPKSCHGSYLIPENFQQRNIQLIQSIKEFLQSDESKFNKFKTHSGQFRQGLISAAQYYKSCRELLGDNFKKIFNELLVLLPDTLKQQELLSAHNDFRIKEKQSSNKSKKNKKNVWQTDSNSDLDCCICPTCKQVLTQQDVVTHKALHIEDEEFPSLQAISRIIS